MENLNNFKNKEEIKNYLIKKWNLKKPTNFELNNWKCKFPLNISPQFLIGLKIFNKKTNGIVNSVNFDYRGIFILDNENNQYRLKDTKIEMLNPFNNIVEKIKLLPGFGCCNIWSDMYYINQKDYKSMYYKTEEYQSKFKKTMLDRYGEESPIRVKEIKDKISNTIEKKFGVKWFLNRGKHYKKINDSMIEKYGVKHPIQNEKIKEKISNTIRDKFGVDWFFERGEHYKTIDNQMIKKYGVKNIFSLTGEYFKINKNDGTSSKIEKEVFNELLLECNFSKPICICNSEIQKRFKIKQFSFCVDFFDEDLNVVIEFMGDFWHCNPQIYGPEYINPITNKKAKETWESDRLRKQKIINKTSCVFLEIWEKDWNEDKQKVIAFIKNAIEEIRK